MVRERGQELILRFLREGLLTSPETPRLGPAPMAWAQCNLGGRTEYLNFTPSPSICLSPSCGWGGEDLVYLIQPGDLGREVVGLAKRREEMQMEPLATPL